MIQLGAKYYTDGVDGKVMYVFKEKMDKSYKVEWWFEGSNRKNLSVWGVHGVEKYIRRGKLKRYMTDNEQKIAENYDI